MRQQYLDYLKNHKDLAFIILDAINDFGTINIELLSTENLQQLAYWWDFEEIKL